MSAPLGIESVDVRRLVLDGLLEGAPADLGVERGRDRVPAEGLVEYAGRLVTEMTAGDPPRRVAVVGARDGGRVAADLATFAGYVGSAAAVGVVELDLPPEIAPARAVLSAGAVPFFRGPAARLSALRDRLGAAVGMTVDLDDPLGAGFGSHELPIRLAGRCTWLRTASAPGLLNVIAALAFEAEGVVVDEALLEESDSQVLALERRRLRWCDRSVGAAALRGVRARLDGAPCPVDASSALDLA